MRKPGFFTQTSKCLGVMSFSPELECEHMIPLDVSQYDPNAQRCMCQLQTPAQRCECHLWRGPYRSWSLPPVANCTRMPTAGATCHQPSKLPGVAIRCTRATARARSALRVPPVANHPGHRRALKVPPVASHPGHRRQAEKPSPSHTATTGLCARDQPSSDTTSAPRLHRCER